MSLLLYRVAMMAIRVALVARDGRLLFPHALASKLHAENALELAQNLLIRNRLAGFILLHDLRLFVDLLRQLRLRELLRQPSLQDGLLHVGAHRLVRQVFIVEFEFQRVSSRPGVYDARATPSVDLFSLSRSRRVVFASRRLRARPLTLSHRVHRDARAQRLRRARPVRRVVSLPPFRARCFPVHRVVLSRASRVVRPFARSRRSFVRACMHSRVVRAFASFAHRGDRLRVLHRLRARPRRPARRPFPDRDLLPILMRHRRRRRRRALTRRAGRRARSIEWVDRYTDRSPPRSRTVRVFSRCRAAV